MLLSRLFLDTRDRHARMHLADPYQMHSTLCRAFSPEDRKCPTNEFLWRVEPETSRNGRIAVLVQSLSEPRWERVAAASKLPVANNDPAIDLKAKLQLAGLLDGKKFRFRLRANPCICRNRKRLGLFAQSEQVDWLNRKGAMHGFEVESCILSDGRMLRGNKRDGRTMTAFSVLYDGYLRVTQKEKFLDALEKGIGHAKSMGLGLLSVVPSGE